MTIQNIPLALIGCAWLALACGGSPSTSAGPQSAATSSAGLGAPGVPWKDKSHAQRQDWMGLEVFPQMKAAFVAHNSEGYADFRCQTCHGANMEAVGFKMPNALFALSKETPIESARDYDAAATDFMLSVVVPKMAQLLDQEPYNPATQQGFGCFGCHLSE